MLPTKEFIYGDDDIRKLCEDRDIEVLYDRDIKTEMNCFIVRRGKKEIRRSFPDDELTKTVHIAPTHEWKMRIAKRNMLDNLEKMADEIDSQN